ncbi:hypothetical protein BH10BDE1_BH10BDE1_33700 [soil metagenome]
MKISRILLSIVLMFCSVLMVASTARAFDLDSPSFIQELEEAFLAAFSREAIVTIETDVYPGTANLYVSRELDGSLASLSYAGPDAIFTTFPLDQLKTGFKVLKNHEGHDAVFLKLDPSFSAQSGGYAVLRILRNGISSSFKNFRVLVKVGPKLEIFSDPDASDPESDGNSYRAQFNYVFMKKNTVFGFAVGIDQIQPQMR